MDDDRLNNDAEKEWGKAKFPKKKKPFYKRGWFWAIIIIFSIGAALGSEDELSKSKPVEKVEEVKKEEPEVEKETEEERAAREKEEEEERIKREKEEKKEKEEAKKAEKENKKKRKEEMQNSKIGYDELARNPDDNMGKPVSFSGKVLQVMEDDEFVQIRFAVNDNYKKVALVLIEKNELKSRLLEDDHIRIYGTSIGVQSYTTVMGAEMTIPAIVASFVDM